MARSTTKKPGAHKPTAKKTAAKTAAKAGAHKTGGRERMTAPKSGVRVRMYRPGHGDCFLLAFPRADADPAYVLIDCGFKPGSNGDDFGLKTIDDIVDNIKAATGGRLDLVVVTHEHQDHVNGFWKEQDPYFEDFKIGAAWFAWTEDPEDDLANELRRRHGDQLLGLVSARHRLNASDPATAQRLDKLLSFELGVEEANLFAAEAAKRKKDPFKSINKRGMKLIKDKAGKKNTKFIRPHKKVLRVPGVEGVRVFALGPPYSAKLVADEDPQGSESFPGHAVRARASFFAAAELAAAQIPAAGGSDEPANAQFVQPFARRFGIPLKQAFDSSHFDGFFANQYGTAQNAVPASVEDATPTSFEDEALADASWRRIDDDWLYSAEDLALVLNEGINNTSLVLAFELEKTGKVLLFVGDAQRGNWISWTKGSWKVNGQEITVRDLLSRTVLYKVGHHGSHNATLNGSAEDRYPNLAWMAHGEYGSEFVAMIPAVPKWAYAVKPAPWRHPLPSIEKALRAKCEGRVLQTDMNALKPPEDPSDPDWKAFVKRTRIDVNGLYFEYDVLD
jgi:hypothetical protein